MAPNVRPMLSQSQPGGGQQPAYVRRNSTSAPQQQQSHFQQFPRYSSTTSHGQVERPPRDDARLFDPHPAAHAGGSGSAPGGAGAFGGKKKRSEFDPDKAQAVTLSAPTTPSAAGAARRLSAETVPAILPLGLELVANQPLIMKSGAEKLRQRKEEVAITCAPASRY